MPLTEYQKRICRLLSANRSPDSYLAGGAAIHIQPNSVRFSNDLDYFHDSEERVARAFADDKKSLEADGFAVTVALNQPGFIRAIVSQGDDGTKIEWAHDSAWRFLPPLKVPDAGYQLHPVDLAVNKVLALAGRDEVRDFLDILIIDERVLQLGALCWAAAGKDPGFTPLSLLELLKRRGRHQPADFERLRLSQPVDIIALKEKWLRALDESERFIHSRPAKEVGCLYYSSQKRQFVAPGPSDDPTAAVAHFGRPGGVLPALYTGDPLADQFR